jgi:hypothetical protein
MAGAALRVLSAAKLLHDQFRALNRAEDFSRNSGSRDQRLADSRRVAAGYSQHTIEHNRFARGSIAVVDVEHLAFFDFQLTFSVRNDGVHSFYLAFGEATRIVESINLPDHCPAVERQIRSFSSAAPALSQSLSARQNRKAAKCVQFSQRPHSKSRGGEPCGHDRSVFLEQS